MTYDLVIIGGTTAARHAAVMAARLQARVALVEPPNSLTLQRERIYRQTLAQIGETTQQLINASQSGIYLKEDCAKAIPAVNLAAAFQWSQEVLATLEEKDSLSVLASLGIDAIAGEGEFTSNPHLAFRIKDRALRARTYLIASGSRFTLPNIPGLDTTEYFTPSTLWQAELAQRLSKPEGSAHWAIIGGGIVATELAQVLVRLGASVTLVVSSSHILPQEDIDVAGLVQAQLEAEGVRILTEVEVAQVKQIDGKKWVLAGNTALEVDEILLTTPQEANVASLSLESVGVKLNPWGIRVNQKLQTTNSQIYACGSVLGGYDFPHLATYEANIAIKNALFLPVYQVDYRSIPWGIFCDPAFARVGLTEARARQQYGEDVLVLRQYFKTAIKALLTGETTGLCKIVVRRNGEILGASIVGAEAGELIYSIALAIQNRLKVDALAQVFPLDGKFSEIIQQAASEWDLLRFSRDGFLRNMFEGWLNWKRSRLK